jgi:hypothetical protein
MIRKSQWVYSTSESAEIAAGPVGMGSGAVYFTSPGGHPISFKYRFIGVGRSVGLPFGITFSSKNTLSTGQLYMVDPPFSGPELKSTDITGFCQVIEGSGIVGVGGGSVTVILLGMSLKRVAQGIAVHRIRNIVLGPVWAIAANVLDLATDSWVLPNPDSAQAMLVMAGNSYGYGLSLGGTRGLGYLSTNIDI